MEQYLLSNAVSANILEVVSSVISSLIKSLLNTVSFDVQQQLPDFLRSYQNYQATGSNSNLITLLVIFGIIFLAAISVAVLYKYVWQGQVSADIQNFQGKAEGYLKRRTLQRLKQLGATDEQIIIFFIMMRGSDNYTAVIESPDAFERYFQLFRQVENNSHRLQVAESLRELFNISFNNLKVEFNHTRLLPLNQKIRVYLKRGTKKVDYLSVVTHNDQNSFSILPPKRNKQWIDITSFRELELRVTRENDSEYQIFSQILMQKAGNPPEVQLSHGSRVFKINTRTYKRYNIVVECKIAKFAESNLTTEHFYTCVLQDISLGGVCIKAPLNAVILEDEIIEIELPIPNLKSLFGRVLSSNRYLEVNGLILNVIFSGISVVERVLIDRYIKANVAPEIGINS